MIVYLLLSDQFQYRIPINSKVLKSNEVDSDFKFADLGIQLDELIYLSKYTVDCVCVVKGNQELILPDNPLSNTVHFFENTACGSFYCKPDVISILSSLYKYNFESVEQYVKFLKIDEEMETHTNKMLHLIFRLGFEIC